MRLPHALLWTAFCLFFTKLAFSQQPDLQFETVVLEGRLTEAGLELTARGRVHLAHRKGAQIHLFSGDLALLEEPSIEKGELLYQDDTYILSWDRRGDFTFAVRFLARVEEQGEAREVDFRFINAPMRRLELEGFGTENDLKVSGAAPPQREGNRWVTHLSPSSRVHLTWQPARERDEGSLFYAIEELSVAAVAAGLVKQNHRLEVQVMQGGLRGLALRLDGRGEVSEVSAPEVLGWEVRAEGEERILQVDFTRPQTTRASLLIRTQTALPVFPADVELLRLRPLAAVRTNGHLLVVNDGAVNLSVASLENVSQVSPAQLPLTAEERDPLQLDQRQAFAFRFAGTSDHLAIHAEPILPEVSASAITVHHLGLNAASLNYDLQLDIREAPLREFVLDLPPAYSLVQVTGQAIADSFLKPKEAGGQTLRLIFREPLLGTHLIRLELEHNVPPREGEWTLPKLSPQGVASLRGHVGIVVDDGLKVALDHQRGLREIIPNFFPVKRPNLQLAWRLQQSGWDATVRLERLEPSIQVEGFHLFSATEGVLYGSTILTYQITGAPVQTLHIRAPESYAHLDFSGAELRDWNRAPDGSYELNLHRPIAGTWSALVTYELPLGPASDPVDCAGVQPLEVKSENGYIVLVSPHQTELRDVAAGSGLLALEPSELPPDYQLLIDAPLLAAYHYTARPFQLSALPQALPRQPSLDQVVELASIETQLTKAGEVLNTAQLVLKSKNQPHFAFRLPPGARLWEVLIDGNAQSPTAENGRILVPLGESATALPRHLTVKYALPSKADARFALQTPAFETPVLRTAWSVRAERDHALALHSGTVPPEEATAATPRALERLWQAIVGGPRGVPDAVRFLLLVAAGGTLFLRALVGRGTGAEPSRWHTAGALIAATCASVGLLLTLLASRSVWTEAPAAPFTTLTFAESVLPAGETLACSLAQVPLVQGKSSGASLALVPVALFAPLLLRAAARRFAPARNRTAATAALFLALLGLLATLPHGAALVVLAAGAQLFLLPLLRVSRALHLGLARPGGWRTAADTAAIACLVGGLAPQSVEAQLIDYTRLDDYLLRDPVHLEVDMQEAVVEARTAFTWEAKKGDLLPLLASPAVIMELDYPTRAVTLRQDTFDGQLVYLLQADRGGKHPIRLVYQVIPYIQDDRWSCVLTSPPSMRYTAEVRVDRENGTISSPDAIGQTELPAEATGTTRAQLRLRPTWELALHCTPKSRDLRLEDTLYYAESIHLFTPLAGSIEGQHTLRIRLAQGRLRKFSIALPEATTVVAAEAPWLESWRFNPAGHTLEVTAGEGLTAQHELHYTTQTSASALPYDFTLALPRCPGAQAETGWTGLATPEEIQLDEAGAEAEFATIGLHDFPLPKTTAERHLRRAWRFSRPQSSIEGRVSAVTPELRVTTEQLTSLGDDRLVHGVTLNFQILRSGIFETRLAIPDPYEIESLTGPQVSHWTETRTETGRIVTLHFKARTIGTTTAYLNLTGPGVREAGAWSPPKLQVLGAAKESGQLVIVPETGLRLQLRERRAVSPLDPGTMELPERNRLVFRLLSGDWQLHFELEPVAPWIEGELLQDLTAKPGQLETHATARYTIKNAGIKTLRLRLPEEAFAVRFEGEGLAGTAPSRDAEGAWMVELDRRVIEHYELQVSYQELIPAGADTLPVSGIQLLDTSVQQSYCALRARQRLRIHPHEGDGTLIPTEWKQVPEELRRQTADDAQIVYRTVDPAFAFSVDFNRLEMAAILPAQMERVALCSIVSAGGEVLTAATFVLDPGHKQHLAVALPTGSLFWSCRVNDRSVWPAGQDGRLLVPLEAPVGDESACVVEILYTTTGVELSRQAPSLPSPRCDLPLENISWQVFLPRSAGEIEWEGDLDLADEGRSSFRPVRFEELLEADRAEQTAQLHNAESLLRLGQSLALGGDPNGARKALESAYSISQYDASFNEDARVQLENLKVQQAMVGLTNRRNVIAPAPAPEAVMLDLSHFSSDEAETLLSTNNSAAENTALAQLATRFLDHQNTGHGNPSDLRPRIPEAGRSYLFRRRMLAEPWQPMALNATRPAASHRKIGPALALLLLGSLIAFLAAFLDRPTRTLATAATR